MNVRPSEWLSVKIEDVVEILDALRVPVNNTERLERIEGKNMEDLYPYYGATGEVGKIDDYIFDEELVALGEDGVPFLDPLKNKAYLLVGKTWVNNHAHVLKGWGKCFNNRFLLHYLNQFDYLGYVNGGTRLKLTQASMRKIPTPLTSIFEQQEIADRLDILLAQVEATQARLARIPDIIKQFRQSVLAAAVSGKLTEDWRELNKGVERWRLVELKEAAEIIDPHPSHRTPKAVDGGVPYIGIGDLKLDGSIDFENSRKVSFDVLKEHNERYTLKAGDFIFGKIGTLGKATILPIGIDYTLSANVILIQPIEHVATPEYLQFFLSSPSTLNEIAKQANSTSQAAFGIKKMRTFQCKLPNKEEQNEIVRRVEQLFAYADRIEQQANAAKAWVDNLTQAILAKAFRGELTADWRAANPDLISGDNSAAALLARIQAERATAKPRKRARKPTISPTSSGVIQ